MHKIVTEHMSLRKLCARWVPKQLKTEHKAKRKAQGVTNGNCGPTLHLKKYLSVQSFQNDRVSHTDSNPRRQTSTIQGVCMFGFKGAAISKVRSNDIRGPCGPKVSRHFSYRWRKTPRKTSPRKLVPTENRTRARCVTGAHATAWPTAVDKNIHFSYDYLTELHSAFSFLK